MNERVNTPISTAELERRWSAVRAAMAESGIDVLLKPGASPKDVWNAYNAFMRENGRPEEKRLHCHSQGYDMVERPLVRHDETMPIGANMVLSCHPTYATERTYSWICDDYLVGESGVTERLHRSPERIFELG